MVTDAGHDVAQVVQVLKAGQSILVNGAGGAVGGYAVQLARQAGATVTATGSARSADRIRSYGADRIIDYTATPLLQAVAGHRFDVVLNLVRTSPEEIAQLADLTHSCRAAQACRPSSVSSRANASSAAPRRGASGPSRAGTIGGGGIARKAISPS